MRRIGLDVQIQEVAPGRPNVIGVLDGRAPGRSLMFCGHMDTVGVEGMTAPFTPEIRSGRLYGRGAQDMKGGVAAMIDAARQCAERGLARGRLVVAAVVDEEYASIGADALVRDWTADAAVVTEPTDLQVGIAHKGFAWIDIETIGRAAHGSRPLDGRDAILRMGRVLQRLEALDRDLQSRPAQSIVGPGSLHASIVTGGRELSSYPERCRLQMERRTIAGESGEGALDEVTAILAALSRDDPEFEASATLTFSRPPYELAPDHALPRLLVQAAESLGSRTPTRTTGMSFWTDAAVLGAAGIATVLFGPGGAGLHSREEYVTLDDVLACRDALSRLAQEWC
jgi:acetylornithine deacetylase